MNTTKKLCLSLKTVFSPVAKTYRTAKTTEDAPLEYHRICNRIALLQNAHDLRLPIPLSAKLQQETLLYDFSWKTREQVVKDFVDLANTHGMPQEVLKKHYPEIVQSRYSIT